MKFNLGMKKATGLRLAVTGLLLFSIFAGPEPVFPRHPDKNPEKNRSIVLQRFFRTELFFGMNKPDDSVVTEAEWNKFLADVVTPKFPDGFTVLEGSGQFRDSSGKIIRENSRLLVLLYSFKNRKSSHRKIQQIRAAYKKTFRQQSVLRLDYPFAVRVSF